MTFLALKSAHSDDDDDDTSSFFLVLSVVHFPILPVCRILCSKKWIFKIKHNWVLFFFYSCSDFSRLRSLLTWLAQCLLYVLSSYFCFHSYLVFNSFPDFYIFIWVFLFSILSLLYQLFNCTFYGFSGFSRVKNTHVQHYFKLKSIF